MCLIDRMEVLRRIKELEQQAAERRDEKAALCYVRAYNAVMSCEVRNRKQKAGQGGPKPSPDK